MEKRLKNLNEQTGIKNICKLALQAGGDISQLIIPTHETGGDGLTNGTILKVNGEWLMNIRRVAYALFHSENNQKFHSPWGPLVYFNPEDDITLTTMNYMCEIDPDNLKLKKWTKTNTSKLDVKPIWEFVGHEDVRLAHWDNILYQTGVRRDTTPNGEGRMELSTIEKRGCCDWEETERQRLSTPDGRTHAEGGSYCEKNWMPINDMPYHYVKWCVPTEIVKVNPDDGSVKQIALVNQPNFKPPRDIRGSSNVIKYKDMWVAIIHECDLWYDIDEKKDAVYHHRILCWDKDWNLIKTSETFNFMTGQIEFTCGLALDGDNFLIPFGFQDHTSFLLKLPTSVFDFLIEDEIVQSEIGKDNHEDTVITRFIKDPHNGQLAFDMAEWYFGKGQYASALGFYSRCAEYSDDENLIYQSVYMLAGCLSAMKRRDNAEELMYLKAIELDKDRPEAYLALSRWYSWRNQPNKAYSFASMGCQCTKKGFKVSPSLGYDESELQLQRILFSSFDGKYEEKKKVLQQAVNDGIDYPWVKHHADKWNIKKNN
jgi:tetratricopeptide (TPR) repeat protein